MIDRVAHRLKLRDLRLLDTVVRWEAWPRLRTNLTCRSPQFPRPLPIWSDSWAVPLIDRGRQGVEPTPHGLALLKRGVAIYDELRQGVAEIEQLSDPTAGEVRIAAPEPLAAGLVTVLIAQFTQKYARASVYVTQTPVASLHIHTPRYRDVRERLVDLVIAPIFEPTIDDDLANEPLFNDRPLVVTGSENPGRGGVRSCLAIS